MITRTVRVSPDEKGRPVYDNNGQYVLKVGLPVAQFVEQAEILQAFSKEESAEIIKEKFESGRSKRRKKVVSFADVLKGE